MANFLLLHLFAWRTGRYTKTRKLDRGRKSTICLGFEGGHHSRESDIWMHRCQSAIRHVEISDPHHSHNFPYTVLHPNQRRNAIAIATLLLKMQSRANSKLPIR